MGEKTAAHASDTIARKFMENGEQNQKLNFPNDHTEVYPEKEIASKFIGVTYNKNKPKWYVQRWSKYESKNVFGGCYDNEKTAAHASDTLARKFMKNGEQKLKLNFPDDHTEVYVKERRVDSGYYADVETAAKENQKNYKRKRQNKFDLQFLLEISKRSSKPESLSNSNIDQQYQKQ